jgi:signal transduction histidine kinase
VVRPVAAWLGFVVAVALPAAGVALVAMRAAAAERTRVSDEQAAERKAAVGTVMREIEAELGRGREILERVAPDATPEQAAAVLTASKPAWVDVAVLGADGSPLFPAGTGAEGPPSERCRAARAELLTGSRAAARTTILAECKYLRGEGGRHLWPLLALETAPEPPVAGWMAEHAHALSATEREVLHERLASRSDVDGARARAALEGGQGGGWAPLSPSLPVWRTLPSGLRVGYVMHQGSLANAREPLPPHLTLAPGPVGEGGDVEVARDLVMHVAWRDPSAAAGVVRRAGTNILAVSAILVLASVALVAALFARARRAQKLADLRTDFVAAVSHELRTPLASLRLLSELLERGDVPAHERAEVEGALAGEARRLTSTVERMLRFGSLARGKLVADRQRVQLLAMMEPLVAERKDVVLEAERGLSADADAGLLAIALENLLSNAAKYAPEGTPYRVRANADGADVVISVADSGPGLDREQQRRVFLPFERADDRLSRATEGTGVGLALVRGIARAHGGDAEVSSEKGKGATFTMRFPREAR